MINLESIMGRYFWRRSNWFLSLTPAFVSGLYADVDSISDQRMAYSDGVFWNQLREACFDDGRGLVWLYIWTLKVFARIPTKQMYTNEEWREVSCPVHWLLIPVDRPWKTCWYRSGMQSRRFFSTENTVRADNGHPYDPHDTSESATILLWYILVCVGSYLIGACDTWGKAFTCLRGDKWYKVVMSARPRPQGYESAKTWMLNAK